MPLGKRTRRGYNRASRGTVAWVDPTLKPATPKKVINAHAHLNGRRCPTCGEIVGVRKDGKMRNHRVGANRRDSWPCPGEEIYE